MALARNPELQNCTRASLIQCIYDSARFGLEVNTGRGFAYLIPFNNRKAGITVCTLQIGYKGMTELARRTGEYASIETKVVGPNDILELEYVTEGTKFRHVPDFEEFKVEDIRAFYSLIRMKDAPQYPLIEVMNRAQVNRIRQSSRCGQVWEPHYDEMGRKTVLKRSLKNMPMSEELQGAIEYDNRQHDEGPIITPSDQRGSDSIVNRLEAKGSTVAIGHVPAVHDDVDFDSDVPIDVEAEEAPPEPAPAPPPAEPKKSTKSKAETKAAPANPAPPPTEADDIVSDADEVEAWDLDRQ